MKVVGVFPPMWRSVGLSQALLLKIRENNPGSLLLSLMLVNSRSYRPALGLLLAQSMVGVF